MLPAMTTVAWRPLLFLVAVLFVAGTLACLPLYRFRVKRFVRSRLFVKICFWWPIFGVFLAALYGPGWVRLGVLVVLLAACLAEWYRVSRRQPPPLRRVLAAYICLVVVCLGHFYGLGVAYAPALMPLLAVLCLTSVLSDVGAFFMGNYMGRHTLPAWLNDSKSWEGVAGQLLGALLGIVLVKLYVVPEIPAWLCVPIGIGSALGDLANSYAKRLAGIKDWSQAIPGHGGFIDRLASLAGAATVLFYSLYLVR